MDDDGLQQLTDKVEFYQCVLRVSAVTLQQLYDWLAAQLDFEFDNGDRVDWIQQFEIIEHPVELPPLANAVPRQDEPLYSCVALATVKRVVHDG